MSVPHYAEEANIDPFFLQAECHVLVDAGYVHCGPSCVSARKVSHAPIICRMTTHAVNALRRIDLHSATKGQRTCGAFRFASPATHAAKRLANRRPDILLRCLIYFPRIGENLQSNHPDRIFSKLKLYGFFT